MLTRSRIQQDGRWNDAVPIVTGTTVTVYQGCATNVVKEVFVDCRNFPFLRFGAFFDQPVTISLLGSLDSLIFFVYETLALAANTYGSVYNLPAPRNQQGMYVLQWPFFQFQITNASGVNTTTQRCWWWIQNYR